MKLMSVSITGFRSIERLERLEIGSPTVLAGHNDAGKSAIIDAILFVLGEHTLSDGDRTYLRRADGTVRPSDGGVARVDETSVIADFELRAAEAEQFGSRTLRVRRISRGLGTAAVLEVEQAVADDTRLRGYESETLPVLKDRLQQLDLPTTGNKSDLLARLDEAAAAAPQVMMWVPASNEIKKALPRANRFDAASAQNAQTAIQATLVTHYRAHLEHDDLKGNVREIEMGLEKRLIEDAAKIRHHIMAKVSDIGDVSIRPSVAFSASNGLKNTEIVVQNSVGEEIDLQLSGAGRARRVALAVWEYEATVLAESDDDVVLLYDEPDTHLDYAHQRELMTLIHQQTQQENVRVVIASHSMNLIDGTDIGDVMHIKHEENRTIIERLADDSDVGNHLGAIAASVGLRNTVLLHERLFVGVEGDSEARAFPVLFKLATGRHLESCGIALWPCGNNEGAVRFAEFLVRHSRNVVFLVDEDSRTNARKVFSDDNLRKRGLDPDKHGLYVGYPNEIEDVFTNEQWAKAANMLWPRNGDDQPATVWRPEDFEPHRDAKFSSNVLAMLQRGSLVTLKGKPEMLVKLALSLESASEVPAGLVGKFTDLIARAS
jgi:putative ATP-dependent endonuclease of the OLD family